MTYKWRPGDKPGVGWYTSKPEDWGLVEVKIRPDGWRVVGVRWDTKTRVTKPVWHWRPSRET